MLEKAKWIALYCTLGALVAGVAGGTVISINTSKQVSEVREMVIAQQSADSTETREDDVTIAGQYTIEPTTAISDAYKSGDRSQLSDKEKETLDMASAVLDEIITDGMSAYEKELAVYRWMTTKLQNDTGILTVIPTTQEDCDKPYGVLKYHNAVCVGYATTFRMFMQMLEIECKVVHNTDKYHSWDLVNLDGNWYHTDIYMDAANGNYANFNMTDEMCSNGHDWDRTFFPAATSLEYNYGYQNSETLEDVYKLPGIVKQMLDEKGNSGKFLRFNKANANIAIAILNSVNERVSMDETYSENTYLNNHWTAIDSDSYLLSLSVTRYGSESSTELTEEEQARITEAVNAAFGSGTGFIEGIADAISGLTNNSTTNAAEGAKG